MNRVENFESNVEIAHHEQFLHLPQCFQKLSAMQRRQKKSVCGKGIKLKHYWKGRFDNIADNFRNIVEEVVQLSNFSCFNCVLQKLSDAEASKV